MTDTLLSPDYILGLGPDQIANLVEALARERQLSRLVRNMNEVVLADGPETTEGDALRHLGFLV